MKEAAAKEFQLRKRLTQILSKWPYARHLLREIRDLYYYAIHKKDWNYKIFLDNNLTLLDVENENTFFGYYDKTPVNPSDSNLIVFHKNRYPSHKKPNPKIPVDICLFYLKENKYEKLDQSFSWNWQQGSRLHWNTETQIIFNTYNSKKDKYVSRIINIETKKTQNLQLPVYDTYLDNYALSLNFDRLAFLRPDYGYRNRPHSLNDIKPWDKNDGIWYIDLKTGNYRLIISFDELINFLPKFNMQKEWHKVNHIMISPDGKKFIFLHRWFLNKNKRDRLFLFDIEKKALRLLSDEGKISHYCWFNDENIIFYGKKDGIDDYYFLNVENLNSYSFLKGSLGNGHPSVCRTNNNLIITDTYRDKSRMKKLILIDRMNNKYSVLGEFLEPLKYYREETRCDLHPNFSLDGSLIHFDTVFLKKRCLALLNVKKKYEY